MSTELLGFNVWTKNLPKSYIPDYACFAAAQGLPLAAIVDDVLPEVVFARTSEETAKMNLAYLESMQAAGYDQIHFVSDILPDRPNDLADIYCMAGRINLSPFLGLLPESKTQDATSLRLNEILDACWQIHVLETGVARIGITRYLTGRRSTALFRLAKSLIPDFQFQIVG